MCYEGNEAGERHRVGRGHLRADLTEHGKQWTILSRGKGLESSYYYLSIFTLIKLSYAPR